MVSFSPKTSQSLLMKILITLPIVSELAISGFKKDSDVYTTDEVCDTLLIPLWSRSNGF